MRIETRKTEPIPTPPNTVTITMTETEANALLLVAGLNVTLPQALGDLYGPGQRDEVVAILGTFQDALLTARRQLRD